MDGSIVSYIGFSGEDVKDVEFSDDLFNKGCTTKVVIEKAKAFNGMEIEVAGKTGTAQSSKSRTNHALFIGFAPYRDPEISIAVRMAYRYTSGNAAALASDVIKYYYNLDDNLITGIANVNETEIIDD